LGAGATAFASTSAKKQPQQRGAMSYIYYFTVLGTSDYRQAEMAF
jgi:hypothetical protein